MVSGYRDQIRKLESKEQMALALVTISKMMAKYSKTSDTFLAKELSKDIVKYWSHLGINEIPYAFELWSLGKIGDKSSELYGDMNGLVLNRVLKCYEEFRKKELNIYLGQERDRQFQAAEIHRRENGLKKIQSMTLIDLQTEVEKCSNWQEIPMWVVSQVTSRGVIKLTDEEKKSYLAKAKEEVNRLRIQAMDYKPNTNPYKYLEANCNLTEMVVIQKMVIFDKL